MNRRPLTGVAVLLVLAGCAPGADRIDPGDLPEVAVATTLQSRHFASQLGTGSTAVRVTGSVEDDHRYHVEASFGRTPAYEELVRDDRRWVRVHDETLRDRLDVADLGACVPEDADPAAAAAALAAGGWIEDAAGVLEDAPAPGGPPEGLLGPSLALRSVRFLDEVPELLRASARVRQWDVQAIDYVPSEDRFEPHAGIGTRFDALPPTYDEDRVFRQGIPDAASLAQQFRFVGVWVGEDGALRRVEVLTDVPDLRDAIERVRRVEAERRGLPASALPEVAVPPDSHHVYEVEPASEVRVPEAPAGAPSVDLVCLAAGGGGVPAPVVADEVSS